MRRTSAPFSVASVQFAFDGNPGSIPLRDPDDGSWLGAVPEWSLEGRRQPAAFAGGTRPKVRVTFRMTPGWDRSGNYVVRATAHRGPGLVDQTVALTFDCFGRSQPVEFEFAGPLPRGIGLIRIHWHWTVQAGARVRRLGITRHEVLHTHAAPLPATLWGKGCEVQDGPHGLPDMPWTYLPVMRWTCAWAKGRRDPKAICDALLANLHRSGLQYALPAWSVGEILRVGGGYCGGWYRMFQAMAASQGVRIERRALHVDWRIERDGVMRWCAMVVSSPGLNRKVPNEAASTFHDSDFGRDPAFPIERVKERRYRFWGHPDEMADGHCLNFLQHRGRWYVYDASFMNRAVALRGFRLPDPDTTQSVPVDRLGTFQSAYLDRAVGHLLGSLRHGDTYYRTAKPDPDHPQFNSKTTRNGLTVKTSIIPTHWKNITFFWTA